MIPVRQWDIVRFRIRPQDNELHPGIVLSGEEWCASGYTSNVNVLACSKRVPAATVKPHQVVLNGADGLEFQSTADCRFFHNLPDLRAKYGVSNLSVFGSFVRGDAGPGSDVDLLVEFDRVPGLFKFVELEDELSAMLGVKVDLVMKTALRPRI
ncbi:MAG: nucleotidyltransferase family protein [Verrucomicrobia bacterium]|nr:nucleotidyltransferase family protein [Verrucomicrobiota bacterium]